jgi:hypothetical protein
VRKKWQTPSHESLQDTIVLIRDNNLARNEWKMGKIIETFPSKNGLIQSVLVKNADLYPSLPDSKNRTSQKYFLSQQFHLHCLKNEGIFNSTQNFAT